MKAPPRLSRIFLKKYIYSYNIRTKLTFEALLPERELLRKSSYYKALML